MKVVHICFLICCSVCITSAQFPGWQWAMSSEGNNGDHAWVRCTASDSKGNFYVGGDFQCLTMTFDNTTINQSRSTVNSLTAFFIIKLNSRGDVLWSFSRDSAEIYDIVTDQDDNFYVVGKSNSNSITLGDTTFYAVNNLSFSHSVGAFMVKFDSLGNMLWAKHFTDHHTELNSIDTDENGNLYGAGIITHFYTDTTAIWDGVTLITDTGRVFDILIVKYSPNGKLLWVKNGGGQNKVYDPHIAVDRSGNYYLGSRFSSPTMTLENVIMYKPGGSSGPIFIARYDSSGNLIWAQSGEGIGGAEVCDITIGNHGRVYVVGKFSGSFTFGNKYFQGANLCGSAFVMQLDSSGNLLFGTRYITNDYSYSMSNFAVAVDIANNVFVVGAFGYSTTIDNLITLYSSGVSDFYIVKYNHRWELEYVVSGGGTGFDEIYGVALDENELPYVAGVTTSGLIMLGNNQITGHQDILDVFISKIGMYVEEIDTGAITSAALPVTSPVEQFTIFPSLVKDAIYLNIHSESPVHFRLFNNCGKECLSATLSSGNYMYDLSDYSSGMYFYQYSSSDRSLLQTGKIIKQ